MNTSYVNIPSVIETLLSEKKSLLRKNCGCMYSNMANEFSIDMYLSTKGIAFIPTTLSKIYTENISSFLDDNANNSYRNICENIVKDIIELEDTAYAAQCLKYSKNRVNYFFITRNDFIMFDTYDCFDLSSNIPIKVQVEYKFYIGISNV